MYDTTSTLQNFYEEIIFMNWGHEQAVFTAPSASSVETLAFSESMVWYSRV